MSIGRLIRQVLNTLRPPAVFRNQEDAVPDQERLDKENFDWDRKARIASATSAFEMNVSRDLIIKIYGEDIITEAERLHKEHLVKKDRGSFFFS
jgi:hypothetical protein